MPTISVKGQSNELPPYNPCATATVLASNCLDGTRTCDSYGEFPCSPGYCWETGNIPVNAGIPANGIVQNKIIEIGSVYTVTQSVKFIDCLFKMRGDSRINISPFGGHTTIKINFENCDFFGCGEMWYGIVVDAAGVSSNLKFDFVNCTVEDAYIGITLDESSSGIPNGSSDLYYSLFNNTFRNNHIGVSNLRQTGKLNAVLVGNQFYQTAELATQVGSLANLVLPYYPLAYAGIKYVGLATVVGVDQHGLQNEFSCLVNGIVTEGAAWESRNNFFHEIAENGILSIEGRLFSERCRFFGTGKIGINTNGVHFRAQRNIFSGAWEEGIHASGNTNGKQILITNANSFNMTQVSWKIGIYLERPQGFLGFASSIDGNTFITNSVGATNGILCIRVEDFVDATDEMQISNNTMNFNATMTSGGPANHGINMRLGNSDRYNVHDNHIYFNTPNTEGVGIFLSAVGGQNLSQGHIVRHNDVTGISTNNDIFTNPLGKCFSGFRIQEVDFCDNTADQSIVGFLFTGPNDIRLRNNHINHHQIGLEISGIGGRIGKQEGHGNEWNLDPNACVQYAAAVYNNNPFFSEFIVPEGLALPWLPPNSKLNPDPAITNWFHTGSVPIDHCSPTPAPLPRQLTPYEKEAVLGTSGLSGVALWDLKLEVYSKLLLFPSLRPIGSPEATFFNGLGNTSLASFANVLMQIRNSLAINATDQQAINLYSTGSELAFANLAAFDAISNYSSVNNLTETWFGQREALLIQLVSNSANETALYDQRNLQLSTALQNALTFNAGISAFQTYESAKKTIYELRIRHLLGQPITQTLYQQALALAQLGEGVIGKSANDAIDYLESCDEYLFQRVVEEGEQGQVRDNRILEREMQLRLAPNPSNGLIEISLPQMEGGWLMVYNSSGQKVETISITPGTFTVTIDLQQSPSGVYWIALSNSEGELIDTAKASLSH